MASRFLMGSVSAGSSSGNFARLRNTPVTDISADNSIERLRIYVAATNNIVMQLDSTAAGANTDYQSSVLTGVPGTGQWIDLGPIDPSRVWVRAATATATLVHWTVTWQ